MGLWNILTGQHPITEKDMQAMTAKQGYIKYAFRYIGGHINYPSMIEAVLELSLPDNPDAVINVYSNLSIAGIEVKPGQFLFTIPLKKIIHIENNNQKEFAGAFLIGGLGALLQETRYFIAIHYYDEKNIKQKVIFGTTPAIKSENYFAAFYKAFIDTITKVNPKALSGEPVAEETTSDLASQLEKLSQLKEKGMLTDDEFIAAKATLLNKNAEGLSKPIQSEPVDSMPANNASSPPAKKCKVSIKGPDDSKKLYLIAKDFCKDSGVTFDKAKEFLTKGVIMSFEDKNKATKFVEKYNQMGCKTELKETQ